MVKEQLAEAISPVILNQEQQLQTIIILVLVIPEPGHLIPDQVLVQTELQLQQQEKQVAVKVITDQLQVLRKTEPIVALPVVLAVEVAVVTADLQVEAVVATADLQVVVVATVDLPVALAAEVALADLRDLVLPDLL